MERKGSDFFKRLMYYASTFSKMPKQKYGRKVKPFLQCFGFFVASTGAVLYFSEKYGLIPSLLAVDESKRKKIVILGTGWAAVNFLRYNIASFCK